MPAISWDSIFRNSVRSACFLQQFCAICMASPAALRDPWQDRSIDRLIPWRIQYLQQRLIEDSDHPNTKCYMWVHRSGELYKERPIVIYEYQKGREHHIPLEFYRDYKGVLVTDGLSQYHLVDKKLPDVTNLFFID